MRAAQAALDEVQCGPGRRDSRSERVGLGAQDLLPGRAAGGGGQHPDGVQTEAGLLAEEDHRHAGEVVLFGELTRTIVRARADLLGSPRAGRRYRNLPLATRLAEQRGRAEADRFLVAVAFFVAAACA
ncbi:hypothetical protein ACIPSJ_21005 [Streptomyces sp. NPDC090088]|uniref:hypothetical protein n=1 Tax=Streptomyces sp. NPDC090088 TaxID=3365944 RepID=UPI0038025704